MKTIAPILIAAALLGSAAPRVFASALADLGAANYSVSGIDVPVVPAPAAASAEKTVSAGLPGTVRAFLDTLAYAEGTGDRYDYIFSHATFGDFSDHPRRVICSYGLCSDAAGRYQFLSTTWDELANKLGLPDFSPASQDKACVEKIAEFGAYDNIAAGDYDNFSAALGKLNTTWASLPGSPYGQPTHSVGELWDFYQAALAKY